MRWARSRKLRAEFTRNAAAARANAASISLSSSARNDFSISLVAGLMEAIVIVLFSGQSNVEIREVSMIHAKHIRFLAFLFSLALLVPFAAFGQSSNGAINGNAVAASGGALP